VTLTKGKPDSSDIESFSVRDLNSELADEMREVMKAAQIRIRKLTDLTVAYASGEISPNEAWEAYCQHKDNWGDALPGVTRDIRNLTDEEITAEVERSFVRDMEQRALGTHTRNRTKERSDRQRDRTPG
jgi:hypothetical protein